MNPLRYLRDGYRWLVDPYGLLDEALARRGLTFRMYDVLRRIGLQAMTAAMFGDGDVAAPAEVAVERFLDSFRNPLILFFGPLRVDAGPWSPWGRALRNRRALCDLIREQ